MSASRTGNEKQRSFMGNNLDGAPFSSARRSIFIYPALFSWLSPLSTHFCWAHSLSHPVSAQHRLHRAAATAGTFPCERLNREAGCRRLCGPARYPPPCSLLAFHIARLFSYRDAIKTPLTVKYVCVFNLFETFCFFSWINKLTDK